MRFMTTTDLQQHHRNLLNSLDLLAKAEPGWNEDDRKRGEATRSNIEKEIESVETDLHMAGFNQYRKNLDRVNEWRRS